MHIKNQWHIYKQCRRSWYCYSSLLEYSKNYSLTSGSLWNYYREKVNDDPNENNVAGNKINNNKTIASKSFEYKTKLIGSTPNDNNTLNVEVVVPLKNLSNFWRYLDFPLINCEIRTWSVISKNIYNIWDINSS